MWVRSKSSIQFQGLLWSRQQRAMCQRIHFRIDGVKLSTMDRPGIPHLHPKYSTLRMERWM